MKRYFENRSQEKPLEKAKKPSIAPQKAFYFSRAEGLELRSFCFDQKQCMTPTMNLKPGSIHRVF
jgi:hypothetical protein